ncbi:MAG: hypothetical protein GKR77_02615 [Legionellales bacterium]|nr:hypothetical protein [Legionellales bacterium]
MTVTIEKALVNVRNAVVNQGGGDLEKEIKHLGQFIEKPLVVMTAVAIQKELAQEFKDLQCVQMPFETMTALVAQDGYDLAKEIKKLRRGTVEQNEAIASAILDGLIQQEKALVLSEMNNSLNCSGQAKQQRKYFTYNLYYLFWWVCRRGCPKTLSRVLAKFDLDVDTFHSYKCKDKRIWAPIGPQQFFVRKYKQTSLHIAIKHQHSQVIEQLVCHGANIDARISAGLFYGKSSYSKIRMKGSLLSVAIILRDVKLLRGLIEQGANLHAKAQIIDKSEDEFVKERCPLTLLLICHWHWNIGEVAQELQDMIMLLVKFGARIPSWVECDTTYMGDHKFLDRRLQKASVIQKQALVQRSRYKKDFTEQLTKVSSTIAGCCFPVELIQLMVIFSWLGDGESADNDQSISWQRKAGERMFVKQLTEMFKDSSLTVSLPKHIVSLIAGWTFIDTNEVKPVLKKSSP